MKKQNNTLSAAEHTAIGAAAGTIEVLINQPTVAIKNALQEGRPLPGTLSAYYRGLLVNAGSIAPITAIQFGAHRALELAIQASTGADLSPGVQLAAATGAGAFSSTVGCPAELIMIQQQKNGRSLAAEAGTFLRFHGALRFYRGLVPTATRDGLVTAGYLGLSPVISASLETTSFASEAPAVGQVCAGIASGFIAAILTQPADTIKTRMQAFVDTRAQPQYRSVLSTAQYLVQSQGVTSLWSGIAPRLFRLCSAFIILQVARSNLIKLVEASKSNTPDLIH